MRALAEQIAVLDGIDIRSKTVMPGVTQRRNVIDASAGGNYSGGSSYAPGLPLLPSTVGLAEMPGVLPARRNVLDASAGANYSGGSSYAPGLPLLPSTVGLAGTSSFGSYVDQDLAGAFNANEIMPNVLVKKNVIDASGGANYSGGSSYAPGLPLLPSTIGLAGLDNLADSVFMQKLSPKMRSVFAKVASKSTVSKLASRARSLRKAAMSGPTPMARARAAQLFANTAATLARVRQTRKTILERNMVNGVPVTAFRSVSPSTLSGMIVDGVPVSASATFSPTLYK